MDELTARGSQHVTTAPYRPDIDGLRAIAVTSVVLYHAGVPFLRSGFVGVDVFFVISGFLIGRIVYGDTRAGRFTFSRFYARRVRRVVPALLGVVIFTLLAGLVILSPAELQDASRSALTTLLGVSNIHYWNRLDYFTPDSKLDPFLMTWTLGVEEQFYLVLPFLMFALRGFGARTNILAIFVLTAVSFAICIVHTYTSPMTAFFLIRARAWELGVGVMLAIWMASGRSVPYGNSAEAIGAAGLVGLIASLCLFSDTTPWPGVAAVLPVAATAALLLAQQSVVNRSLLGIRLLVGVGLISYSWYLWHWPIMTFIRVSAVQPPSVGVMIVAAAISLVIAIGSWRYIEQPFRRVVLPNSAALTRYAVVVMAALCVPIFLLATRGLPNRLPSSISVIDDVVRETHANPCMTYGPKLNTKCVSLVPNRPTLAIIGDSHAAALAPAIQTLAQSANWGSVVFAKSSCRPLKGVTVRMKQNPDFAAVCATFMEQTLKWVTENPSVQSVILAGLWIGPITDAQENYQTLDGTSNDDGVTLLAEGLQDAILYLQRADKRVFVAQDVPYWPFDAAKATRDRLIPFRNIVQRIVEPDFDTNAPLAAADPPMAEVEARMRLTTEKTGATYMPVRRSFCVSNGCFYRKGEMPLFVDQSHLSATGAQIAIMPFRSIFFDVSKSN